MNGLPGVRRVRSSRRHGPLPRLGRIRLGHRHLPRAPSSGGGAHRRSSEQLPEKVHTEIAPITGITGVDHVDVPHPRLMAYGKPPRTSRLRRIRTTPNAYSVRSRRPRKLSPSAVKLPEYQINVKQDDLRLYGISPWMDVAPRRRKRHTAQLPQAIPHQCAQGDRNTPAPETPASKTPSKTSATPSSSTYIDESPITIGQVAEVRKGPTAPKRGSGSANGKSAVAMAVSRKHPSQTPCDITEDIDRVRRQMSQAGLPARRWHPRPATVMRQSDFINLSVTNLVHVLRDAAIFVAIVLVTLPPKRYAQPSSPSPRSHSPSPSPFVALDWLGLTINVMTLGGLAIAIGELVDDAIIDVENVFRQTPARTDCTPTEKQIANPKSASSSMPATKFDPPVVFATAIIVIRIRTPPIPPRYRRPLLPAHGLSPTSSSILASLLVALTVDPRHSANSCSAETRNTRRTEKEGFIVRWL